MRKSIKILTIFSIFFMSASVTSCTSAVNPDGSTTVKFLGVKVATVTDNETKVAGISQSQAQGIGVIVDTIFPVALPILSTVGALIWGGAERFAKNKTKSNLAKNIQGFGDLVNRIEEFKREHPDSWNQLANIFRDNLNKETKVAVEQVKNPNQQLINKS